MSRLLENFPSETQETKVSYVAATPKPPLVKLSIMRQGRIRSRSQALLTTLFFSPLRWNWAARPASLRHSSANSQLIRTSGSVLARFLHS